LEARRSLLSEAERNNYFLLLLTDQINEEYLHLVYPMEAPMTDAKSEVMYGTLDLIVLKALDTLGSMHGFGMAERIHQVSKELLTINQGTLYASLARLEQSRCITSKWGVTENNRKARYYSITKAGQRRLAKEAEDWGRMAEFMGRVLQGSF
jgi:PadR family transcriptional regulator, regulatory protein PadR